MVASIRSRRWPAGSSDVPLLQGDPQALGQAIRRSNLAAALAVVTEPWSNMVLREAFMGTRQFEAFQQRLGIPRQTLSLCLAHLVDAGLMRKQRHPELATRQEYRLTARGRALHANVLSAWLWDRRWGDPMELIPKRLVHLGCKHGFRPVLLCEHCAEEMPLARMQPRIRRFANLAPAQQAPRGRRWRSPSQEGDTSLAARDILAVIDDRWSLLVVLTVMLGLQRYDELATALGISSAVLARRLQRLCALELLRKHPDPTDARRSTYQLDKAGRELFPYLMSLSRWGGGLRSAADTIEWQHLSCGKAAKGRMACSHCREDLLPAEVTRPALRS